MQYTQKRFLFYTLIVIQSMLLSGCGLLFGKKSQNVLLTSVPEGASVYLDDIQVGETPVVVNLRLKKQTKNKPEKDKVNSDEKTYYSVRYIKPGFREIYFDLKATTFSKTSPNRALCILDVPLFGIPLAIDSTVNACDGYENVYSYDLDNGKVDSISYGDGYSKGSSFDNTSSGTRLILTGDPNP